MAERRMFSKSIIFSDDFTDMPLSAQALYFHLAMTADDDGFINNPKRVQRMIGATDEDAKSLCAKQFIIPFDSGIVAVKDWRIHNYIRKDTYGETLCKEEKALLEVDENKAYRFRGRAVNEPSTQGRLGKDRLGKDSIGESESNISPTLNEIKAFCKKENLIYINTDIFFNHYGSASWSYPDGRKINDWQSLARKWNAQDKEKKQKKSEFAGRETMYGDSLYVDTSKLEV